MKYKTSYLKNSLLILTLSLFIIPISLLQNVTSIYASEEPFYDQEELALKIADNVSTYRSNGKVILFTKTSDKNNIFTYNLSENKITTIETLPGEKKLTHLWKNILVFDWIVSPEDINVVIYDLATKETIKITEDPGIQREGVTNSKYIVWWDENDHGNLWAYHLETKNKFKITQDNFPNFSDWYDEKINQDRIDCNDYKVSELDYVMYGLMVTKDSNYGEKRQKIICYDLTLRNEFVLCSGTGSDFGFYPAIYYDLAVYTTYVPSPNKNKRILYQVVGFNPADTISLMGRNQESSIIYSKEYLLTKDSFPFVFPSFFEKIPSDDYYNSSRKEVFCSFKGIAHGSIEHGFRFPMSKYGFPNQFFGNGTYFVSLTEKINPLFPISRVLGYQLDEIDQFSEDKSFLITPNQKDKHCKESFLYFKNQAITWIDTDQEANKLFLRLLPELNYKTSSYHFFIKPKGSLVIPLTIKSEWIGSANLEVLFPEYNPDDFIIKLESTQVFLKANEEREIPITIITKLENGYNPTEIIIQIKSNNAFVSRSLIISIEVSDVSLLFPEKELHCFYGESIQKDLLVKNLSSKTQKYALEVRYYRPRRGESINIDQSIREGGKFVYSIDKMSIELKPDQEEIIHFTASMFSESDNWGSFIFSIKKSENEDGKSINIPIRMEPGFTVSLKDPYATILMGDYASLTLKVQASERYEGTLNLVLNEYGQDKFLELRMDPSSLSLKPNEIKYVTCTILAKTKKPNMYNHEIYITATDQTTSESNFFLLPINIRSSLTFLSRNKLRVEASTGEKIKVELAISSCVETEKNILIVSELDDKDEEDNEVNPIKFFCDNPKFKLLPKESKNIVFEFSSDEELDQRYFDVTIIDEKSMEANELTFCFILKNKDGFNMKIQQVSLNNIDLYNPNEAYVFMLSARSNTLDSNEKVLLEIESAPDGTSISFPDSPDLAITTKDWSSTNFILNISEKCKPGGYEIQIRGTRGTFSTIESYYIEVSSVYLKIKPSDHEVKINMGETKTLDFLLVNQSDEDISVKIYFSKPDGSNLSIAFKPTTLKTGAKSLCTIKTTDKTLPGRYLIKVNTYSTKFESDASKQFQDGNDFWVTVES